VADDLETPGRFEFRASSKWLFVKLKRPLVDEILQLIRSRSEIAELADIKPEDVSEIYISDESRRRPIPAKQKRWRDRIALFGCAIVGFVVMLVFFAGVAAIVQQLRGSH
jgi:hypothetical protein